MSEERYEIYQEGYHWYITPEPQPGMQRVFVEDGNVQIEPCGDCPDGYSLSLDIVDYLLVYGLIVPHFYDESPDSERYQAVVKLGIGFDIAAASETEESDVIWKRIDQLESARERRGDFFYRG
jgi:hypothetical protein